MLDIKIKSNDTYHFYDNLKWRQDDKIIEGILSSGLRQAQHNCVARFNLLMESLPFSLHIRKDLQLPIRYILF
jgi:hypothetical protein